MFSVSHSPTQQTIKLANDFQMLPSLERCPGDSSLGSETQMLRDITNRAEEPARAAKSPKRETLCPKKVKEEEVEEEENPFQSLEEDEERTVTRELEETPLKIYSHENPFIQQSCKSYRSQPASEVNQGLQPASRITPF